MPPAVVGEPVDCQRGFWVSDLVEGVRVPYDISAPEAESGESLTPYKAQFIVACQKLIEGQDIRARQRLNPWQTSDFSTAVSVGPKPNTLNDPKYKPVIIKDVGNDGFEDVSVGTTLLKVSNLLVGASVDIYEVTGSTRDRVGGGIATGESTMFPVRPLTTNNVEAQQSLCDLFSPTSDPVTPKSSIDVPKIEKPICEGASSVTAFQTELGARVELRVKSAGDLEFKGRGSATAPGPITIINVGGDSMLATGDELFIRQINETLKSDWSTDAVLVSGPMSVSKVSVKNGYDHSALPDSMPAFHRGVITTAGYGPQFQAIMCGAESAQVEIHDPYGELIEVIDLNETKKGYFEGGWDWTHAGWSSTSNIPIGVYTARFIVNSSLGVSYNDEAFFGSFDPHEIRENIVVATKNFNANFGNYQLGLDESGVNEFFDLSPTPSCECFSATQIIMARGIIRTLEPGEFDVIGYTSSDMRLIFVPVASIDNMKLGDWSYIRNDWDYRTKHPGEPWQGENIIKVGPDKYFGQGGGVKSYTDWVNTLIHHHNSGLPADEHVEVIPGFQEDLNQFFDVIAVSWDAWSKSRKP